MKVKKENISDQEEGEEQLAILIKEAGEDARKRRKRTLDKHFEKLDQTIKKAASQIRQTAPK